MFILYVILAVVAWLLIGTLAAILQVGHDRRVFPNISNNVDMFSLFLIACGPIGLIALILTIYPEWIYAVISVPFMPFLWIAEQIVGEDRGSKRK